MVCEPRDPGRVESESVVDNALAVTLQGRHDRLRRILHQRVRLQETVVEPLDGAGALRVERSVPDSALGGHVDAQVGDG